MIKTFKIYTAGKMGGLGLKDQMKWRADVEYKIKSRTDKSIQFIHPPRFYTYGEQLHKSERETMVWDLNQIRDSDIVIVDLSTISDTIGTHIELGFVEAMNQFGNKHIYVIGIGDPNNNHPWIDEIVFRKEDTIEEAADYIVDYLLV